MKYCPACERELLDGAFRADATKSDGLHGICKKCEADAVYARRLKADRDSVNEQRRQARADAKFQAYVDEVYEMDAWVMNDSRDEPTFTIKPKMLACMATPASILNYLDDSELVLYYVQLGVVDKTEARYYLNLSPLAYVLAQRALKQKVAELVGE